MSEEETEHSEVYNHYLELSKPTKEDFERVFTEDELKELCLRHKCRVDMWRWNVANDYRVLFTESGRYQRWSDRHRLYMLSKAVNRMKPSILYKEEEIEKTRKEEWGFQLKENILSLNFWKHKRLQTYHSPKQVLTESDGIDEAIQSQCEVHTESMDVNELLTQTQGQELFLNNNKSSGELEVLSQFDVHTESMNTNEVMTQTQGQELQKDITKTQEVPLHYEMNTQSMNAAETHSQTQEQEPSLENIEHNGEVNTSVSDAENLILDLSDEDYLIDEDSEDSVDTVLNNEPRVQLVVEALNSEEVAPEIENIYGVNTLSMTIDSAMCTQSQDLPLLQSQDVIPQNYDNFKNIIPLTSTQSQSIGSEEL